MTKTKVDIYCDGSCLGNPGAGGYAALLVSTVKGKHTERLLTGFELNTTNNKMELSAAICGLTKLKTSCQVTVYSDSNYVVQGMREWMKKWKKNNFHNSSGKPVANRELWEELDNISSQHDVNWVWVKAHNGHIENERVDQAAREAALNGLSASKAS